MILGITGGLMVSVLDFIGKVGDAFREWVLINLAKGARLFSDPDFCISISSFVSG